MQEFKIKIGGSKYKARFVQPGEIINKNMLYAFSSHEEYLDYIRENIHKQKLHVTQVPGEPVDDYSQYRVYIEIVSAHYKVYE